jgi:predicted permease
MALLVFESLLPVFLVISAGFAMRKSGLVAEKNWQGIESLGYWLLFPALVLESLIKMDFGGINLSAFVQAYATAITIQILLVWLLRRPLHKRGISDRSYSSIFQTTVRWNGFMALGIANSFSGSQGVALVALIMAFSVPLLNFITVIVLTVCTSDGKPSIKTTLVNTLKMPLIWAALLGFAINVTKLPIYPPLMEGLDMVGRAGLSIGLLAVGAGVRWQAMKNGSASVFIGVIGKIVIFPIIVFLCCWVFSVTGLPLQIAMLSASVSTAMNGFVLARQMGGDAELYAAIVSLQVVLSVVTIPLMLGLGALL